jgi:catechol 2,3-dioxygenase-like lactoylglutathione lyase family enzyme
MRPNSRYSRFFVSLFFTLLALGTLGCGQALPETEGTLAIDLPEIQATNAFYYYTDVEAAHAFYSGVLGFETVADYGFAKILRVAPTSYLTLVDEAEGMHSAEEPKSVTLAIVTEQVEGWYAYLASKDVTIRGEYDPQDGRPHDGFVAVDPEGYFLEFERFNPHPENTHLLPALSAHSPLQGDAGVRPAELQVQATVLWLYYDDVPAAQSFWERTLDVSLIVDQGWAKVYPASPTGYVGLVDGTRGLHEATDQKGVTVSFFTDDVDRWLIHARALEVELRTPEITNESDRVRVFVAYDPEGYFLEWDTFLNVPGNERLTGLLAGS